MRWIFSFFLQRCKTLTSLEHDKKWILELENKISCPNYKNRWSLVLRDLTTEAINRSPYLDYIKNQKKEAFDLISIDGRLRSESLKIASSKVKRGGFILLDNSDRHQYQKGVAFLNELGWNRKDYEGICYGLEFDSKNLQFGKDVENRIFNINLPETCRNSFTNKIHHFIKKLLMNKWILFDGTHFPLM